MTTPPQTDTFERGQDTHQPPHTLATWQDEEVGWSYLGGGVPRADGLCEASKHLEVEVARHGGRLPASLLPLTAPLPPVLPTARCPAAHHLPSRLERVPQLARRGAQHGGAHEVAEEHHLAELTIGDAVLPPIIRNPRQYDKG